MNVYRVLVVLVAMTCIVAASCIGPALLRAGWPFASVAGVSALVCSGVTIWAARALYLSRTP